MTPILLAEPASASYAILENNQNMDTHDPDREYGHPSFGQIPVERTPGIIVPALLR